MHGYKRSAEQHIAHSAAWYVQEPDRSEILLASLGKQDPAPCVTDFLASMTLNAEQWEAACSDPELPAMISAGQPQPGSDFHQSEVLKFHCTEHISMLLWCVQFRAEYCEQKGMHHKTDRVSLMHH